MDEPSRESSLISAATRNISRGPSHLYKFRAIESDSQLEALRQLLVEGRVWLADPFSFNDPFDCWPAVGLFGSGDDRISEFMRVSGLGEGRTRAERRRAAKSFLALSQTSLGQYSMAKQVHEYLGQLSILCLSQEWDNILLWAHYGGAHTGVCVRFRRRSPVSLVSFATPVTYERARPIVSWMDLELDGQSLLRGLVVKALDWKYEKEWRFLCGRPAGLQTIPKGVIDQVILGARITDQRRSSVMEWCREAGIEVVQAAVHTGHFGLGLTTSDARPFRFDGHDKPRPTPWVREKPAT